MDGLKPGRGNYTHRAHARPASHRPAPVSRPTHSAKDRHSGEKYFLVRSLGKIASKQKQKLWTKFRQSEFGKWPDKYLWRRVYVMVALSLFVFSTLAATVQPFLDDKFYGVTEATRAVLPSGKASLANYLKYDSKNAKFVYNENYNPVASSSESSNVSSGVPRISASFAKEASKGVTVTDATNKVDFKLTPNFKLNTGKQDQNQIFYPLAKNSGYLVYTSQIASVKEDIVLEKQTKDRLSFEYNLDVANGLEARLEKNGTVGIYGSSLPINGSTATGNEKDAALLQKARENAKKDKLIFVIPAPVVKETGKESSSVRSHFELEGSKLTVVSEGLKGANYPLSIDPSVYVQSAAQLMRGNNETNVEFDVATEQFKKGTTTGARIDEWTDTTDMNDAVWDQGTAAAGGYVYKAGGKTSRIMPRIVEQKTTSSSTQVGSQVISMPTNRPAGDLYITYLAVSGATITPPAGWTLIANTSTLAAYYRIGTNVSGGNEAASYTWTTSVIQQYTAVVFRVKNFDPADVVSGSVASSNGTGVPQYPSVTPDTQGSLLISASGFKADEPPRNGYSPNNSYTDVLSSYSSGTAASAAGLIISSLDSPPLSATPVGVQNIPASAGISDTWGSGTIAINGVAATTAYSSSVQWAHFNSTNGTIDSPAPGSNGTACTNWCTNSAYDLPTASPSASNSAGLIGSSLIAYNGYLYNIGGYDGNQVKSTVYIAKLGANGEPSLWHPTDPVQANWTYWYKDSGLSSALAYQSAYAFNGKMYVVGGRTSMSGASPSAQNTVYVADILPDGRLGSWSSGATIPVSGRYGAAVQGYNNYLYLIGGNNGSTVYNTVYYSKLNSDGSMNAWQTAGVDGTTFSATGRTSQGGLMSGIWGAYIYLAGGCTAINTTGAGNCTSIASDVQLASINSDGTLDVWNTMATLRNQRFGYSFVAWQDSLYRFGGCSRQDTTSGDCYSSFNGVQYGNINQDGDASTVSVTSASGSGACIGADPYDCNLPPLGDGAGQGAQMLSATAILNGYLYVIGGCSQFTCSAGTAVSANVAYAAISSDGKLKSPPSCDYTLYGSWCVDNTNQINGTTGIAASGVTVFGGYIYVVGGLNGSANVGSIWRNTTNNDGSLSGGWTTQTFANLAITTSVSYTFAYARANPSNATYPGNLYIFGGCGASNQAGCTAYQTEVYKCNILANSALEEADANDCVTNDGAGGDPDQLQIDSEAAAGSQGLGIHAGAVYANYIYLVGGVSDNTVDRRSIMYAKFDNNNNVVAATGSAWTTSSVEMNTGRRRGTAFGYNGYLYAVGGFEATINQALDTIEFVKINVSDGSLTSDIPKPGSPGTYLFTQSAVTINQRWGLSLAVSNSFAYIIGGCNVGASPGGCSSFDPTIQTFQVYNNDSGAPSTYTKETDLFATDRIGASAAVYNGYIYVAGGCVSTTDCTDATNSVQYAQIDAYGDIGSWSAGGNLPADRAWGQLEVVAGTLYYLGGQDDTATNEQSTVYYTSGISSGNPTWTGTAAAGGIGDTSGQVAQARTKFSSTVWNNRIYVVGGLDGSAAATSTVYISPQLNSGGTIAADSWTTGTSLPIARSGLTAIAYGNNLYVLGGYTGTTYLSDVQFSQINGSTGASGSWTYTTSLPTQLSQADGFAVNGYMYMFGGRASDNECRSRTLVAPISANTTIATGNNPTGIGEWYQTNRTFDTGRYGASAVNYQGKSYVLGGGCQGVVQQDDFDPGIDTGPPSQWSNTTGATADTTCQSSSSSNTLRVTGGAGNQAATKDVNVDNGATINFKLFIPQADVSGCLQPEGTFLFGQPENVQLQYSTNAGSSWTTLTTYAETTFGTLAKVSVSLSAAQGTTSTRFRWIFNPTATIAHDTSDMFAIDDVSVIAVGSNEIAYTGASRVAYTTLLSQPQVANYSRLVDAGKDVFPTSWLLNGLDNSIGARWQFAYRSMNDSTVTDPLKACGGSAMSGFGQLTNFGDSTLGLPGKYTAKNSGGTDIGCSRYFFMNISIDASQTYGYPDDISRGPTLDNFSLFFQSNPGSRLLHGKTFIDGGQQPLDTPCGQTNPLVSGNPSASGCKP